MADIIKMDYATMEEAAATHKQAAATISEMIGEVKSISAMLEEGGLIGRAGASFAQGLSGPLTNALTQLCDKYTELQGDIMGAMDDMQQADSDTTRFYN